MVVSDIKEKFKTGQTLKTLQFSTAQTAEAAPFTKGFIIRQFLIQLTAASNRFTADGLSARFSLTCTPAKTRMILRRLSTCRPPYS